MTWHKRLLAQGDGMRQWYWSDPDTGDVKLENVYDVQPIIEDAKGMERTFDRVRHMNGHTFHHYGFLPHYVWDHFMKQGINLYTDKDMLRKYMNDPNFRAFRTRPGVV